MLTRSRTHQRGLARLCAAVVLLVPGAALLRAQASSTAAPEAGWSLNAGSDDGLRELLARSGDHLEGYWRRVPGVRGQALEFDGYTTGLWRDAARVPALHDSFTVSAWVALDAYPWNWLPVVDQSERRQVGFSLAIDAFGHVGLGASVDGVWQQVTTEQTLPLKRWAHVTGVFQGGSGLSILIDGRPAAHLEARGRFWQAGKTDLVIGRVRGPEVSFPAWISHPQDPIQYSLEGFLDEVGVWDRAVTADEDRAAVDQVALPAGDVTPRAVLPSGPAGKGRFGAMYASLSYTAAWDRMRRLGPDSDVVVRFDRSAMRLVFWQGTNFIPAWVTENGKWYTDEFLETFGAGCGGAGDCEPMSDKQSRYSHVQIVQSSDARAVIHWRYALAEARNYEGANADARSGWFDWADEYWTVYPDGVAVRQQVLRSSALDKPHEWQESIVIHGPGERPEDNIEADALTLENMAGEKATYRWEPKTDTAFSLPKGPAKLDAPKDANMQIVHLKSAENPFQVVWPQGVSFDTYNGEPSYSMFEWWNHWPVAQVGSSGRPAIAPDRASHTSLSHLYWAPYAKTAESETKLMLCGLTGRDGAALLPLAKSWLDAPEAKTEQGERVEFDPAQRGFVVHRVEKDSGRAVSIELAGSAERPLVNPVLVVEHWSGNARVRVTMEGKKAEVPVRQGIEHHLEGDSLVIYMELTANRPVQASIEPTGEGRSPTQ